jgi:hypothetical protein
VLQNSDSLPPGVSKEKVLKIIEIAKEFQF